MIRIVIFYAVLAAALLYAVRRGGAPERITGAMMAIAALATSLLPVIPKVTFFVLEWPRLAVDLALLAGLMAIAAKADRFWPILVVAFQILTVASHAVRAMDAQVQPIVYTRITAWLAYPLLLIFVVGVYRHARRIERQRPEFDWTAQRVRRDATPHHLH